MLNSQVLLLKSQIEDANNVDSRAKASAVSKKKKKKKKLHHMFSLDPSGKNCQYYSICQANSYSF